MKNVVIVLVLLLCGVVHGADGSSTNLWFPVGETLHYKMKWGIIPIGRSRVEAVVTNTGSKAMLSIRYYVKTNRMFDKIYPVNDFMESLVDLDTFVPLTFTKRIQRRKPRCDETVVFDRKEKQAHWYSQCLAKHGSFDIDDNTRDIMTLLYLMRKNDLVESQAITNQVVIGRDATDMVIRIGKKEKLDVAGRDDVECFKVVPVAKLDDILVEEGEVKAWVSADARRILTRLHIKAAFGTVKVYLDKVEGPGPDDGWVKKGEK